MATTKRGTVSAPHRPIKVKTVSSEAARDFPDWYAKNRTDGKTGEQQTTGPGKNQKPTAGKEKAPDAE